jgi:PII-like signaling protein
MRLVGTCQRLTIYCGELDHVGHQSLARAIVERARQEGLAGATAFRGIEGFGASSRLHTARLLSLSDDLPIVIQIVDTKDRLQAFLPLIDEMVGDGLVTIEDVEVCIYRAVRTEPLDDPDADPVS